MIGGMGPDRTRAFLSLALKRDGASHLEPVHGTMYACPMEQEELADYLQLFLVPRDKTELKIETAEQYVARMLRGPLPRWPTEVLVEWLYRHDTCLERYAFLRFESLMFERATWKLQEMQGRAGPETGSYSAISASEASKAHVNDNAAHAGV